MIDRERKARSITPNNLLGHRLKQATPELSKLILLTQFRVIRAFLFYLVRLKNKMAVKKKTNTALVYNPNRRLSIGGAKTNPVKKRKKSTRRKNPVRKISAKSNPVRRRNNPASMSGLLIAAVMAGIGVSIFDVLTNRIMPQSSGVVRAGVKLGGAWLFQSQLGNKIPVLAKYKNDIALVLAVSGVVDLMKLYVLPLLSQTFGGVVGLLAPNAQPNLIAVPVEAANDGTVNGFWQGYDSNRGKNLYM